MTVTSTSDLITFQPGVPARVGLIFFPGARVDPRAYAVLMRGIAARGVRTFIVKMPYNIAFLGQDRATAIIAAHLEIDTWTIGGHSLGGVAACSYATAHTDTIKGLLLLASYPASDLSAQLASTAVLSIYGTNDGLATPQKIDQNRLNLPATTQYLAIEGGVHAFFGDYGPQPGDGQPVITREAAQTQIVARSADFLRQPGLP